VCADLHGAAVLGEPGLGVRRQQHQKGPALHSYHGPDREQSPQTSSPLP